MNRTVRNKRTFDSIYVFVFNVNFQGETGDAGRIGLKGVRGAQGQKGEHGLRGWKGATGDFGEIGENGLDGRPGNIFYKNVKLILSFFKVIIAISYVFTKRCTRRTG